MFNGVYAYIYFLFFSFIRTGLEAIDKNLVGTVDGLTESHRDLKKIEELTTRLVSLKIQQSQTERS